MLWSMSILTEEQSLDRFISFCKLTRRERSERSWPEAPALSYRAVGLPEARIAQRQIENLTAYESYHNGTLTDSALEASSAIEPRFLP